MPKIAISYFRKGQGRGGEQGDEALKTPDRNSRQGEVRTFLKVEKENKVIGGADEN